MLFIGDLVEHIHHTTTGPPRVGLYGPLPSSATCGLYIKCEMAYGTIFLCHAQFGPKGNMYMPNRFIIICHEPKWVINLPRSFALIMLGV